MEDSAPEPVAGRPQGFGPISKRDIDEYSAGVARDLLWGIKKGRIIVREEEGDAGPVAHLRTRLSLLLYTSASSSNVSFSAVCSAWTLYPGTMAADGMVESAGSRTLA